MTKNLSTLLLSSLFSLLYVADIVETKTIKNNIKMLKKVQLLLVALLAACSLMAQPAPKSVSINQSDIQFWVGNGSNSTVVAIGWDASAAPYTPTVVVWGIHWNGTITLLDALDSIALYDSRFSYIINGSFLQSLSYIDPAAGVSLTPYMNWNCNNYNGVYGSTNLSSTWLRISESTCDNYNFTGVNNLIYASNPNAPADASIQPSDILYWVGNGPDSAIFVISNGSATRAWGYLFDEDDAPTAFDMASDIDAADPRLAYTITDWSTYDMGFVYKEGPVVISIPDTRFKVDGTLADSDETLADYDLENGSFIVVSNDTQSVWQTPITPATVKHMPVNSTISTDDILYWVGTGSNEAAVVVNWGMPDTALAWGLRFDGSITISQAIDAIASADPRVSTDAAHSTINYTEGSLSLAFQPAPTSYMQFIVGNNSNVNANSTLANGDQLKIGESAFGVGYDSTEYMGSWYPMGVVWNTEIHPVTIPGGTQPVPEDASIDASAIVYWVGTGSNEAVLAVNWADTALAWGYRFDGESVSCATMMADIAAADPRFSFTENGGFIADINFSTDNHTFAITPGNYWFSLLNHTAGMGLGDMLHNGDFYKWGDLSVAVVTDSSWVSEYGGYWNYTYIWPYTINPVSIPNIVEPTPEEATIDASAIEYWVGTGASRAILAVNWADTALAWGYRFDGSKSVSDMMSDIAAADPRFSFTENGGFITDINFTTSNRTFAITPGNYWSSTHNGMMDAGLAQPLADGDFEKWADPAAGIIVDSTYDETYQYWWYTYVYPMTIHPASQPAGFGPFCGAVGTEGCTAVRFDDNRIKAWATECTVVRGSQNLSDPDAPDVTYGDASQAVGAATAITTDVVSLGDGGSATLTFDKPIANGNGYDFAVFENSFSDGFLELAFVEVSSDGNRFVRFPATSLTQTARQIGGNGPVDPTYINNLAGKYRVGFGTPFDLEELRDSSAIDINNITHVRIVDAVGSIDPQLGTRDARGNLINDPFPTLSYSAGFDLDGIAVLNTASGNAVDMAAGQTRINVYPNPASDNINIVLDQEETVNAVIYDMSGRKVHDIQLHSGINSVDISNLSNGVYILRADGYMQKVVKR